jgi:hypothetical protein
MDSRAHPGSNVTGVYKKLYVAQSLKVMAQAAGRQRHGRDPIECGGSAEAAGTAA